MPKRKIAKPAKRRSVPPPAPAPKPKARAVGGDGSGGIPPVPEIKLDPTNAEQIATIRQLGAIHCTQPEAAAVLRVRRETFNRYLAEHPAIREQWEAGQDEGKASLRRAQFKSAIGDANHPGNVTAQIWLGKQILGQTDNMALLAPKGEIGAEGKHVGVFDELVRALDQLAATRAGDAGGSVGVAADRKANTTTTH